MKMKSTHNFICAFDPRVPLRPRVLTGNDNN